MSVEISAKNTQKNTHTHTHTHTHTTTQPPRSNRHAVTGASRATTEQGLPARHCDYELLIRNNWAVAITPTKPAATGTVDCAPVMVAGTTPPSPRPGRAAAALVTTGGHPAIDVIDAGTTPPRPGHPQAGRRRQRPGPNQRTRSQRRPEGHPARPANHPHLKVGSMRRLWRATPRSGEHGTRGLEHRRRRARLNPRKDRAPSRTESPESLRSICGDSDSQTGTVSVASPCRPAPYRAGER